MQQVILAILDGWGIGRHDFTNPIHIAKPKNINYIKSHYLSGSLQSSGIAVGLPWEEEGNSEVGHLSIGAGKIIYQHFPRITIDIQKGAFFKNKQLIDAFNHAKKNNSSTHLIGLASMGNIHSSLEHVNALLNLAKQEKAKNVFLHIFADGKDSPQKSVLKILEKIQGFIKEAGVGIVSSISGRYYALDRDNHWNRTEKTYQTLTGEGLISNNIEEKVKEYYNKGLSDEFIEPFLISPNGRPIKENDSLIFFDFREDSIKQIAGSFIQKDFENFKTKNFKNLYITTFTHYSKNYDNPVAFPSQTIDEPLGKVLSDKGLVQLRLAETEKYAHVTFFFNGYRERAFKNEYRVLIPSKTVSSTDEYPEMMSREVSARVIESIGEGSFNFILVNFANPDMVAHTGNFDAAVQAIMAVDEEIGKISKICLEKDVVLMITSDHGNIEKMIDPFTGEIETKHDPSLVPLYIVGNGYKRVKREEDINSIENEASGILADIAPTVLDLMDFSKPKDMTGQSLLKYLR